MLAKKFRLPIQNWAKGKNKKFVSQKGNFFIAKIKDNDLNFSRLGLVISTRINKSAVKRNLLKRTIFNFVRLNKFFGVYGKDILLIILPTASHLEKTQIEKELLLFFKSLNQWVIYLMKFYIGPFLMRWFFYTNIYPFMI